MEDGKGRELILYPCYFDARLMRRQGRRVPRALAMEAPVVGDLERALRRLGIEYRTEGRHHPAHWEVKGGRLVVRFGGRKSELLRLVAGALERGKR